MQEFTQVRVVIDLDTNNPAFGTDPEERVRIAERALAHALASVPDWRSSCHNEGTIIDGSTGFCSARWTIEH